MKETEDIYLLTPSRWNPHDGSYATNEESMLDWEGNMITKKDRIQVLLLKVAEDTALAASVQILSIENCAIDTVLQRSHSASEEKVQPCWKHISRAADEVSSVLVAVSPILNDETLYDMLHKRAPDLHLTSASDTKSDSNASSISDGEALDDLFSVATRGEIDLDEVMLSATHAGKTKGVDATHLSKMWRIDLKTAECTLEVTSQSSKRVDNPTLSRNYGTNDRMLRYKRISEYFFMDTFYATKTADKSTRKNMCCKLFVTCKGFVYVVPLKSKSNVLDAVKQFAKEI
jgi:hypothetical protein